MRKLLLFIVLLGLPLALIACGGGEEAAPTGETPARPPGAPAVSIDLWHSETAANLETLERLTGRFNASQDRVTVRPVFQGNDEELTAKLMVALGSGSAPALVYLPEVDTRRMIDSGAVRPLQDFIDRDDYDLSDFEEKAIGYYTVEDKLWAMPMGVLVQLLYYNKIPFREVGLDPEKPPRDLEEVRQYSEKLLKRDASGKLLRSGVAMDITPWYLELALAQHGDLYADNNNGRDGRPEKVLFSDNETASWFFRWWDDTVDQGLTLNVGRNPGAEGYLAVASGRAAMVFGGSPALRSVLNALEEGIEGVEIGLAAWPGVPGGTPLPGVWTRSLWILNQRPDDEQEAAWEFIRWLMEPEQQAEWFAGSGYLPVRLSALALPAAREVIAKYPLFQVPVDIYLDAPSTPASLGPLIGATRAVREPVAQAIEGMLSGSKDPIGALEEAADSANEIIKEYNERVGD